MEQRIEGKEEGGAEKEAKEEREETNALLNQS